MDGGMPHCQGWVQHGQGDAMLPGVCSHAPRVGVPYGQGGWHTTRGVLHGRGGMPCHQERVLQGQGGCHAARGECHTAKEQYDMARGMPRCQG